MAHNISESNDRATTSGVSVPACLANNSAKHGFQVWHMLGKLRTIRLKPGYCCPPALTLSDDFDSGGEIMTFVPMRTEDSEIA